MTMMSAQAQAQAQKQGIKPATLKPTTPLYIRKKWPLRTKPEWCWFNCGTYIYFDRNVLSKSVRRIPIQVEDNEKHQCPCNPASEAYDENHPTFIEPSTITVDLNRINSSQGQMVEPEPEPEPEDSKHDEDKGEEEKK